MIYDHIYIYGCQLHTICIFWYVDPHRGSYILMYVIYIRYVFFGFRSS